LESLWKHVSAKRGQGCCGNDKYIRETSWTDLSLIMKTARACSSIIGSLPQSPCRTSIALLFFFIVPLRGDIHNSIINSTGMRRPMHQDGSNSTCEGGDVLLVSCSTFWCIGIPRSGLRRQNRSFPALFHTHPLPIT
jgi:hypothetical protein